MDDKSRGEHTQVVWMIPWSGRTRRGWKRRSRTPTVKDGFHVLRAGPGPKVTCWVWEGHFGVPYCGWTKSVRTTR